MMIEFFELFGWKGVSSSKEKEYSGRASSVTGEDCDGGKPPKKEDLTIGSYLTLVGLRPNAG